MKQRFTDMLAVRLVALSVVSAGAPHMAARQAWDLGGLVVEDHTGAAAAGAVVRLSGPAGPPLAEAETDRAGRFALTGLSAGEYALEIAKPNHVPAFGRVLVGSDRAGGLGRRLTIRLVRTGDARFAFDDLPPGQYHLAAHADRGAIGRWAPETGRADPAVELEPGARRGSSV